MKKNTYMKPGMVMVKLQHQHIICSSEYGINTTLQEEEVSSSFTRESGSVWDDEW